MRIWIAVAATPILLAACGGPIRVQESASSVSRRDLTLGSSALAPAQVVSKIEMVPERTARRSRRPRAPEPARVEREMPEVATAPAPVPAPEVAPPPVSAPIAETAPPDPTGRELAPGATVTIVPVSSPASSAGSSGDWSEVPAPRARGGIMMGGGHGGRCGGGRGRGPVSILK